MSSKTDSKPRTSRPWSLAARLALTYALVSFSGVLVVSIVLYVGLVRSLDDEDDQFLQERVRVLASLLSMGSAGEGELRWEVDTEWRGSPSLKPYARILDDNGTVLLETQGMREELPESFFPRPVTHGNSNAHEVRSASGRVFRIQAVRNSEESGARTIQVALDQSRDQQILSRYRYRLAGVLGMALLAGGVAGYEIARRGVRPVVEIAAAARRVGASTLHERMNVSGLPSEISALATTFNEMLDRLEHSFQQLSRFSADIAHELRTPLNNLRGEAEVALSRPRNSAEYVETLTSGLEEIDKLSRVIDSLLFLARTENAQLQIAKENLDLGAELRNIREFYGASAAERGVNLLSESAATVRAETDRTLLHRAIGNLVSNSIAHTPAGGYIWMRCGEVGSEAWIEIRDNGEGIPAKHLPHVFERFYQADSARSNGVGRVGLGLAIVQAIARVHRGSVDIESVTGEGTCVRLRIPRRTERITES